MMVDRNDAAPLQLRTQTTLSAGRAARIALAESVAAMTPGDVPQSDSTELLRRERGLWW